jgi:hypothetical protein
MTRYVAISVEANLRRLQVKRFERAGRNQNPMRRGSS